MKEVKTKLEKILERCIDQIIRGESTLEDCLANYPQEKDELEPLLRISLTLSKKIATAKPSKAAEEKIKEKILRAVALKEAERKEVNLTWPQRIRTRFTGVIRIPLYKKASLILVILTLLTLGAVVASANSLPNSPLYPMKLGVERVKIILTLDDFDKVQEHLLLAKRRLKEAHLMLKAKNLKAMETTLQGVEENLKKAQMIIKELPEGKKKEALKRILSFTLYQQRILNRMLSQVPEEMKGKIYLSIKESKKNYGQIRVTLEPKAKETLPETTISATSSNSMTFQPSVTLPTPETSTIAPAPLEIDKFEVFPSAFSPNGDKVKDYIVISVEVKASNLVFKVDIYDTSNKRVTSNLLLKEKASQTGKYQTTWGGESNKNEIVKDGTYFLKVKDEWNNYSPKSVSVIVDTTPPEAPSLLAPLSGEKVSQGFITFIWEEVVDADSYVLEYSTSADFSSGKTFVVPDLPVAMFTLPVELPEGNWYWRVRGLDHVGNPSSFSPSRSFIVTPINEIPQ